MMIQVIGQQRIHPALRRLDALTPLDAAARVALLHALGRTRCVERGQELLVERQDILHPFLIARGWAARVRVFPDGRRQILSFLLAGDLIGVAQHANPCAASTVIALTDIAVCTAPNALISTSLTEAYAIGAALDEAYLLAHIARLGRLTAHERICDLLLELLERLQLAGLADTNSYDLPLTQDKLADVLGLTAVHTNRMLQFSRREGELTLRSGHLVLADPVALAHKIGRTRTCTSNGAPLPPAAVGSTAISG
jgi:CRP-like cAMP-binding protein